MKVVSSMAGPSQEGLRFVEMESALEAKKLELQALPCLASENSILRAEVSQIRGFVKTPGRERRETDMLTQDVQYLTSYSKNIRTNAETEEADSQTDI